ncbi:hypothetical protein QTJ16_006028 [Diplocarpon rosae]|uniref:PARP-type domain-containing protein n=1 Tax=Diplocarpon rosae TaxID=946125 RepID=A0AAD9SWA3_9HELO|nr:hypothetical protein QTJ16_006028 [Diplocarpon rosae]
MPYRVETASSARAGCNSSECKAAGIKIEKDELRLGVWVPYEDRGSWKWRHWGCITGKVIEGIRNLLVDPANPGTYRWDMLDGYDSEGTEKNSLERKPDLQEKVRRCIIQGFIDDEDFNGDPEMNVLGAAGLRTKESKKKMKEDQKLGEGTQAGKKRASGEIDGDEATPVKKKRAIKKMACSENDEDIKQVKPATKHRTKKVKKEEDREDFEAAFEDTKPVLYKTPHAKKGIKKEGTNEMTAEAKPAPTKNSRAKKGVKKEEEYVEMSRNLGDNETLHNEEDFDVPVTVIAPKKRALRGKKTMKAEPVDEDAGADAFEPAKAKPAPKKRGKNVGQDSKCKELSLASESNSGVTETAFIDANNPVHDRAEVVKGGLPTVAVAAEGEDSDAAAMTSEAVHKATDLAPRAKGNSRRRTRSRMSSSKF